MKKTIAALALVTASLVGSAAAHASAPKVTAATALASVSKGSGQDPGVERPWAIGCHGGKAFKLYIDDKGNITGGYLGIDCLPGTQDFIIFY